jgi:hypothetical protein
MGLFSKKPGLDNLFLQFPDGSEVGSKQDMDRLMSEFTFTPSTLERWRLQPVDNKATAEASARLWSIGFNEESIMAFGPVRLREFPKSHNVYDAEGILTPNYLIIYYYKSPLKLDYLILPLLNLSGLTSTGPWSAEFNFKNGIHQDKSGTFEMAETFFVLSERLSKDGQSNRRSVTLMKSLANTLNEVHLK